MLAHVHPQLKVVNVLLAASAGTIENTQIKVQLDSVKEANFSVQPTDSGFIATATDIATQQTKISPDTLRHYISILVDLAKQNKAKPGTAVPRG